MSTIFESVLAIAARQWARRLSVAFCLIFAGAASAQLVDIATGPLYSGRQAHPNVVVTTSVEFPTVGAAYLNILYASSSVYLGYFDSTKCYVYIPSTAIGNSFGNYFAPTTLASPSHECTNTFSGNFMNWATMSAIDEFRYAMTGGNRVVDPTSASAGPNGGTIVQRATLPDGTVTGVSSFFNFGNFPGYYFDYRNGAGFLQNGQTGANTNATSAPIAVLPPIVTTGATNNFGNCGTYIYFAYNSGGNCNIANSTGPGGLANALNLTAFEIRVSVCDLTEGPVRTDLCVKYPGGLYKPVGQIEVNAANMRFAAFGYLMDRTLPSPLNYTVPSNCDFGSATSGWNDCRYGGVLRAPMKYVGATSYDAAQNPSSNTRYEIDPVTGALVADPERSTSAPAASAGGNYSGVINFINKFGSGTNATGAPLGGVYKRLDPGGEMFYEAVRYYQNLGPTALATASLPTTTPELNAIKDYYPITTTWTDPIGSICANNYIINLSDTNMWEDAYVPGYTGTPAVTSNVRPTSRATEGGLDAVAWTRNIGLLESTVGYLSPSTTDVDPGLAGLETRYASSNQGQHGTFFEAGIAYWANVNDIRTDLAGKQTIKTFSFDVNEQESPTRPVQDRVLYLMGKYGGFYNTIDRASDTFAEPFYSTNPSNPQGPAIRSDSEWIDSNGFPVNYVQSTDPSRLINGLRSAFARINATPSGTLSGAGLTSANLTYGSAGAYVATFSTAHWSGSVLFDTLSVDANGALVVSTAPVWDAGALLTTRCGPVTPVTTTCNDQDTSTNRRNIFTTIKPLLGGTRTAAPFSMSGISSDASYLLALNTNPATGLPDLAGQARINYLRGYRGDEGTGTLQFRLRDSPMGDVVNSAPVYVGPPSATIPDADYQSFYFTNANRTPAVYVGANDGMLHAFRASDGFELFGYIPNYSYPDLNALTNPGYSHKIYVDTVPKVQEVKLNGTWKTVLVGANGNGAQGIFGLDVTDPTSFGTTKVLFEFSDADDPDFGSVVSAPEIAKLWVSGTAAAPVYRYFAVVTSYNKKRATVNGRTDTSVSSDANNKSTLFLIALDHVLGTPWTSSDYYKFYFYNPSTVNSANPNGLGPVTLLLSKSGDLTTSYMYFGDLQGNLWKFDTTGGSPSTWKPVLGTVSAPLPIFVAQDSNNNRQPITARPALANGPFGSTLVYFGTGEYFGTSDLTLPATTQSEYALLDVNPSVLISRSSDLVPRTGTVVGSNVQVTGAAFSYSGTSGKKGWYLDFPSVSIGERSITTPAIRTGLLTFTTLTLSNDLCTPGNGYIYQVDALTGLPFSNSLNGNTGAYVSTVGIPGPPRVVDLTLSAGSTQATGEVINKKTLTTLVSGTSGSIAGFGGTAAVATPPTQEINWREITNFNDRTGR